MKEAVAKKSEISVRLLQPVNKKNFSVKIHEGELWTARQRQMHSIHYAISYRASFKPELPDFFIRKYGNSSKTMILDPFGGRGTTIIQANLLGLSGMHNDINPVSLFISSARQIIPELDVLIERVQNFDFNKKRFNLTKSNRDRLLPFFHCETLQEILNMREILLSDKDGKDSVLRYIGLTALSRLYGHSSGFFSVYTFPQISIMPGAQERNNRIRGIKSEYKSIRERIVRKMQRDISTELPAVYHKASKKNRYMKCDVRDMYLIENESVDLIITSPPFLNKVNYLEDNWMRAWFLGYEKEISKINLMMTGNVNEWVSFMHDALVEMGRVLKTGGRAIIEVGEVTIGRVKMNLDEMLLNDMPLKTNGGVLYGEELFINKQDFTKLSNCWDVKNNNLGTNTNRCLVLQKR